MFAVAAVVGLQAQPARGRIPGITTTQFIGPNGCNDCHSGGTVPTVLLSGPAAVAPDSTNQYTLQIFAVGSQNRGGLNVSAPLGTLSVGGSDASNTHLLTGGGGRREVTHTGPKAAVDGVVTFTFLWTAPSSFSTATLDAWGNAVDGSSTNAGDRAAFASLSIANDTTTPIASPTSTATTTESFTPSTTPTPSPTPRGQCQDFLSTDIPKSIPDSGSAQSVLNVALSGAVTDVNVLFLIGTHQNMGDLELHLIGPGGSPDVGVMNRVCGGHLNFDLNLDDAADSSIPCPPTDEGTHLPSNPLSAFNGVNATGTWTLQIFDRSGGSTGALDNWGLEVCVSGGAGTHTPTLTPTATPTDTATRTPTETPSVTPTNTFAPHGLSGRILYYSNASPVAGVNVEVNGPPALAVGTDDTGHFAFTSIGGHAWEVKPRKIGGAAAGISALDAAWVLQYMVGLRALSAEQRLACDVSGNGTVTAYDAALILQRKVGIIAGFTVADTCGSEWAFVPVPESASNQEVIQPQMRTGSCQAGSIKFQPLASQADGQDFFAVLFGDCTGNWQPDGGATAATSDESR